MSTTAVSPRIPRTARTTSRALAFRIAAGLLAVVFIVLFGAWRASLSPWLLLPDSADHGWQRTAELHVLADAASGVLMLGVGIAAILLVIQPFRRTVLVTWLACTLVAISLGTLASTLLQGHDGLGGALLTGVVSLCVFVVPMVLLHPQRRMIMAGGQPSHIRPSRPIVLAFTLIGLAALAGAVAVAGWRLAGGLFENPAEDDVVSLVMLGLSLAVGCGLCARGRDGWRVLAVLILGLVAYCVVAGFSIAWS